MQVRKNLTDNQAWHIRRKVSLILASLHIAKEKMELNQNWKLCCSEAIDTMGKMGMSSCVTNARTVMAWYGEYRENRMFPVIKYGEKNLPLFLVQNDDIKEKLFSTLDQISINFQLS